MTEKKYLADEIEETMKSAKSILTVAAMSNVSNMDMEELARNMQVLAMFNKLFDLCGAMLIKQDALMDKMDRALDKYLKG